jgi:hypothetical protein
MHYYDYLFKGVIQTLFGRVEPPEVLESEEWWLRHGHEHRLPLESCHHTDVRRPLLPARFWFWRLEGY